MESMNAQHASPNEGRLLTKIPPKSDPHRAGEWVLRHDALWAGAAGSHAEGPGRCLRIAKYRVGSDQWQTGLNNQRIRKSGARFGVSLEVLF